MTKTRKFIGVATPQANPTVEIEFQTLMRAPGQPLFTRLTSQADSSNKRLRDYMQEMPAALASFDTLPLRAFGFACTGSAYLLGEKCEEEITDRLIQKTGIPIVTATQAIRRELELRGARKIAMLAPYPIDLCEAACAYWARTGFDIVASKRIDIGADTRAIYDISDDQVNAALAQFDSTTADLVLLSGTGMPSIAALQQSDTPMLSSNLSLVTELLRRTQLWPANEAADINTLLGT